MTPRENMLSLYRRTGYAFAPVEFWLCPALHAKMELAIGKGVDLGEHLGFPEGFARAWAPGAPRVPRPEPDWRRFYPEPLHEQTSFNDYGVAQESGRDGTHHLWRMHHPLSHADSLEQLQAYPWPSWDFTRIDDARAAVQASQAKGLPAFGGMACTIWETAWYIRDMTVLMMDMVSGDPKATFILDKLTEDAVGRATWFGRSGADFLCLGDDIGMQQTIMMSPELYREWLKPRLARVIAAARAEKPDIIIHYHSCGYVEPFIPDLIEIGVDVLNPVQPECMDFAALHAEYGSRLSFNGTIGTQTTMPFGTPADVRATVWRNLETAGSKGGLLAAPTHVLEPEVPWENVLAYFEACRDFRP